MRRRKGGSRSISLTRCTCFLRPAFNALLEDVGESRRPHVKFVFATTDVQGRYGRPLLRRASGFDLKPISIELIVERLRKSARGEENHRERGGAGELARTGRMRHGRATPSRSSIR